MLGQVLRVLKKTMKPDRNVLPVAAEVGEPQRVFVQNLEEPGRTAAMLYVGLTIAAYRRDEKRISLGDEGGQLGRDHIIPTATLFHRGVAFAGTEPLLNGLHRRRKRNITNRLFHDEFSDDS